MAPPAINDNNQGIFDKARDMIHNTVATDSELEKEKPLYQKVNEAVPNNATQAGAKVDETAQNLQDTAQQVKQNVQDMVPESFQDAGKRIDNIGNDTGASSNSNSNDGPGMLEQVRENIYDATKSQDVKRREDFENADLKGKLHMMQQQHDEKKKDTIPGASVL